MGTDSMMAPLGIVGNLNVDQIVATVSRFPTWDEELLVEEVSLALAGTAGYLARAAHGLGISPHVVSTIGNDVYGTFLLDELHGEGIETSGIETITDRATSIGVIFVGDEGQRGILTLLGAHEVMNVDVAERHDHLIASCCEVMLCGSYLLPEFSPEAVIPYARKLRERGQVVVFDPSWDPAGWGERTQQQTFNLLPHVDLYMPNDEELCHLTGESDLMAAIEIVRPLVRELVVKRGAAGAMHVSGATITEVPGFSIQAVNTIGAGDIFDVGFLFARRHGWDARECLAFACATAAYVVSQRGERHYPDMATVQAFRAEATCAQVAGGDGGCGC